jgi:hypothetical protein
MFYAITVTFPAFLAALTLVFAGSTAKATINIIGGLLV